jgi:hypothetical protein
VVGIAGSVPISLIPALEKEMKKLAKAAKKKK